MNFGKYKFQILILTLMSILLFMCVTGYKQTLFVREHMSQTRKPLGLFRHSLDDLKEIVNKTKQEVKKGIPARQALEEASVEVSKNSLSNSNRNSNGNGNIIEQFMDGDGDGDGNVENSELILDNIPMQRMNDLVSIYNTSAENNNASAENNNFEIAESERIIAEFNSTHTEIIDRDFPLTEAGLTEAKAYIEVIENVINDFEDIVNQTENYNIKDLLEDKLFEMRMIKYQIKDKISIIILNVCGVTITTSNGESTQITPELVNQYENELEDITNTIVMSIISENPNTENNIIMQTIYKNTNFINKIKEIVTIITDNINREKIECVLTKENQDPVQTFNQMESFLIMGLGFLKMGINEVLPTQTLKDELRVLYSEPIHKILSWTKQEFNQFHNTIIYGLNEIFNTDVYGKKDPNQLYDQMSNAEKDALLTKQIDEVISQKLWDEMSNEQKQFVFNKHFDGMNSNGISNKLSDIQKGEVCKPYLQTKPDIMKDIPVEDIVKGLSEYQQSAMIRQRAPKELINDLDGDLDGILTEMVGDSDTREKVIQSLDGWNLGFGSFVN